MSQEIGSTTTRKVDPENIGVAVRILIIRFIVSEILLFPVSWPPHCFFRHAVASAMITGDSDVSYVVINHKSMYCFWNDMCICKTSNVIGTSGNLAAINVPRKYHR